VTEQAAENGGSKASGRTASDSTASDSTASDSRAGDSRTSDSRAGRGTASSGTARGSKASGGTARTGATRTGTARTGATRTGTASSGTASSNGAAPRKRPRPRSLNARQAALLAARHVLELTGHQPENVVSIAKDDDGWHAGIEVVELRRIPDSADILAVYELVLDPRGELVSYSREQRYHRGSTERD
jgi:Gas vesicle synthesis protein GvpO